MRHVKPSIVANAQPPPTHTPHPSSVVMPYTIGPSQPRQPHANTHSHTQQQPSPPQARGAAAAARRRAKRHAPHGQGVGALLAHYLQPSKNCVLLSLLVMVGLAQLLGILDMLFSKRRR